MSDKRSTSLTDLKPLQPPANLGPLPSPRGAGFNAVPAHLPGWARLDNWGVVVCLCILLILAGILVTLTNKDDTDRIKYCDMVFRGAWPDYRGDYAQECVKGKARPAGQKPSRQPTSRVLT